MNGMLRHIALAMMLLSALCCRAIVYVYDEGIASTFLFNWMGAPTPAEEATAYYDIFHPKYVNQNMGNGQYFHRQVIKINFDKDKELSDTIKKRLTDRSEEELWNLLDRQTSAVDLAYTIEQSKIENYLMDCDNDIGKFDMFSCPSQVKSDYMMRLACIREDLELIRGSYQPMSKRKEQYLSIYKSAEMLHHEMEDVLSYLKMLRNMKLHDGVSISRVRFQGIVSRCLAHWKGAMGQGYNGSSGM